MKISIFLWLLPMLLFNPHAGQAQDTTFCDSLFLEMVRFAPFDNGSIEIEVTNTSSEIFSYPGFLLMSPGGDTLAKEEVSYYGIGGNQFFYPQIQTGLTLPGGPNSVVLELWTHFYQTLACSFPMEISLCPPSPCNSLHFYFGNYGNGLVVSQFSFELRDSLNQLVYQGGFELDSMHQATADSFCLEPGDYSLVINQVEELVEGQSIFGLHTGSWIGPHPEFSYNNLGTGNELSFSFYTNCLEYLGSPVLPPFGPGVELRTSEAGFILRTQNGSYLSLLEVFDLAGRKVLSASPGAESFLLPASRFLSGLFVLRVQTSAGEISSFKISF